MTTAAAHTALPLGLRLKHRVAVSPLAGPVSRPGRLWARVRGALQPDPGLLRREDGFIDNAPLILSRAGEADRRYAFVAFNSFAMPRDGSGSAA